MATPYRVMTVCTGNICRSPMAEIVLRARFAEAGLGDAVVVDSTGVSDEEQGNPLDRRARAVLESRGYDLPALAGPAGPHRARRVRPTDLASRDLVLAMTTSHAQALRRLDPDAADRVMLFRVFDADAPRVDPHGRDAYRLDVDDPWYGDRADFEVCLDQVEAAAAGIVAFVAEELRRRA